MKVYLQSHWKLALVINLILGVALWVGFFTDVSLRGTIPDILFPPFVAIFALITIIVIPTNKRIFGSLMSIPSFSGGCLYLIMGFIMLIPPLTLVFLFGASEIASEVKIQKIASPNNIDFAEVYFRPVGAYAGGSGKIYIRVVNKFFPLIERDIYSGTTYTADEETSGYLKWIDDNTLFISETDEQISIGNIQPEIPTLAIVPLVIVGLVQNQIEESQLTAPLNDIPIYPARTEDDSTNYWAVQKTAERGYSLPQEQTKEVYNWHLSNLSKPPWEIINSQIVLDSDPAYQGHNVYVYCITALKHDGNKTTVYYFEIDELHAFLAPDYIFKDLVVLGVGVSVATPNPDSIYCWLK